MLIFLNILSINSSLNCFSSSSSSKSSAISPPIASMLLALTPFLLNFATREKKPFIYVFVSHSSLVKRRSPDSFLEFRISQATWDGSAFFPVNSPKLNFVIRYCRTFGENLTHPVLGLLKAQPICSLVCPSSITADVDRTEA